MKLLRAAAAHVAEWANVYFFLGAVAIALSLWWGAAWLEARAYERVTGKTVSTWDALFLELRVDGVPEDRGER